MANKAKILKAVISAKKRLLELWSARLRLPSHGAGEELVAGIVRAIAVRLGDGGTRSGAASWHLGYP